MQTLLEAAIAYEAAIPAPRSQKGTEAWRALLAAIKAATPATPANAPRVTMCCETCGSTDVRRDAYAAWSDDEQQWELVTVFDHADCETCGGETTIVEKPL